MRHKQWLNRGGPLFLYEPPPLMTSEPILLNVVPMLLSSKRNQCIGYKYYLSLLLANETFQQDFPELCNENIGLYCP